MSESDLIDYLFNLTQSNSLMKCFHLGYIEDLNADRLNSIYITGQPKEYPLVLMAPPISSGSPDSFDYERYSFSLFFFEQQLNENDLSAKVDNKELIWYRMADAARDYFLKIREDMYAQVIAARFPDGFQYKIDRIKEYGGDKVSGVRIDFEIELHRGCDTVTQFA